MADHGPRLGPPNCYSRGFQHHDDALICWGGLAPQTRIAYWLEQWKETGMLPDPTYKGDW